MLRRKATRLTDSPEFERAYRRGMAYRGKLFSVHAFPNELETVRLGLSVSRKVGNAVTRNTVRRRLRGVFHEARPTIKVGLDLVLSARQASAQASYEDLQVEFAMALAKLRDSVKPGKK